jgi:hypothetical protein
MLEAIIGAAATLTTEPRGTWIGHADATRAVSVQNASEAKPQKGPSSMSTGQAMKLVASSAVAASGTAIRRTRRSLDKGNATPDTSSEVLSISTDTDYSPSNLGTGGAVALLDWSDTRAARED